MRHPLDPKPMHDGAKRLGEVVGRGLLDADEASAAIKAAVAKLPADAAVDRSGLQCRLHWAMTDAARAVEIERNEAARQVCAAIAPLLARRAPATAIYAAAIAARGCLTPAEASAVALEQALLSVTP